MDALSKPFAQLSDSDHGPLIIVATYIFLTTSCLAMCVKIWTRLSTAGTLVATDWLMLAGIVLAVAQASTLTIAVENGLGQRASDLGAEQLEEVSKALYATNILTILVLAAAKSSIVLLIVSVQPFRPVVLSCYILLAIIASWCVAGSFALAFQCHSSKPWTLGGGDTDTCVDQFALQVGLGVVDIITDLAIVALAFFMMRGVQTNRQRKWMVIALFGLRISIPPFTICALVTYRAYYYSQPQDRTWHAVAPVIWTQVMLSMSIITSCIPSIKRFFIDVQSGLMGVTISEVYELTHSGGKATQLQNTSKSGTSSGLASKVGVLSASRSQGSRLSGTGLSQQGAKGGPYANMAHGAYGNTSRVEGKL
ncbi:hypothetical protein LTR08_007227 [Meristemomyces frigidus]|nr:hypothetical protein LTR08_007227 [Meristemomyces frigidus]